MQNASPLSTPLPHGLISQLRSLIPPAFLVVTLSLILGACVTNEDSQKPTRGEARFETLLHNPKWYRTFDSTQSISSDEGTLNFAWTFSDPLRYPDSFHIGIDTLWMLPQNVKGDTSSSGDWDLQICPDGFCQGGLASGVRGYDSPAHFGGQGEFGNPEFVTEHHVQFYPAIDVAAGFSYTAPPGTIVGALLYVRSRSGKNPNDTVFAYGAWGLEWDTTAPPPVRPKNGQLPRRSDFTILNGKVRYTGP